MIYQHEKSQLLLMRINFLEERHRSMSASGHKKQKKEYAFLLKKTKKQLKIVQQQKRKTK